jgi:hypothetical protein
MCGRMKHRCGAVVRAQHACAGRAQAWLARHLPYRGVQMPTACLSRAAHCVVCVCMCVLQDLVATRRIQVVGCMKRYVCCGMLPQVRAGTACATRSARSSVRHHTGAARAARLAARHHRPPCLPAVLLPPAAVGLMRPLPLPGRRQHAVRDAACARAALRRRCPASSSVAGLAARAAHCPHTQHKCARTHNHTQERTHTQEHTHTHTHMCAGACARASSRARTTRCGTSALRCPWRTRRRSCASRSRSVARRSWRRVTWQSASRGTPQ